jgi:Putative Ig domain
MVVKKKIAVLTFLLLAFASYAGATCNTDILNEYIAPFYAGVPGSYTLEACCGTPGYTFTINSGSLPAGLTMNSSGVISGTATTTGYTTVCITVTDAVGCHVTRCYEVYVF